MYSPWRAHVLNEGVIDILFSADGKKLHVLGTSGSIYVIDLEEEISYSTNKEEIRVFYIKKDEKIAEKMNQMGLTSLTKEAFRMKNGGE